MKVNFPFSIIIGIVFGYIIYIIMFIEKSVLIIPFLIIHSIIQTFLLIALAICYNREYKEKQKQEEDK